jgi:hypothetical protein
MSTWEIAAYVIRAEGWDADDRALRTSVTFRIVNTLRVPRQRERIERVERRKGVVVWTQAALLTLPVCS